MFPSPVFSSQVLRCGRDRLQRHRPILYYAAEANAADAASACEQQESGSGHWRWWGSLGTLTAGHLSPDTEITVQVSRCHSHCNFSYYIHVSLFLTNSVTSDIIFEKLQSCQSRLSYILIINSPQISMAQINKGFFSRCVTWPCLSLRECGNGILFVPRGTREPEIFVDTIIFTIDFWKMMMMSLTRKSKKGGRRQR